jgi:hypothetical protein
MKPGEFSGALSKAAKVVAAEDAANLTLLAEVFAASSAATVAATLTRLGKAGLTPSIEGHLAVGEAVLRLGNLVNFLKDYGKPAFARDLCAVLLFLQRFEDADLASFASEAIAALTRPTAAPVPVLNEAVVQKHLHQLEQALGNNEAFSAAYNELERDPEVGKLEIADLAKRFTDRAVKSRAPALKKIWARHSSLMSLKGKSESRVGRSAA